MERQHQPPQQQRFKCQRAEEDGKEKGKEGEEEIEDMWTPDGIGFEVDGDFWEVL